MKSFQGIFYKLPSTIAQIFSGRNLLLHGVFIALTFGLVVSGFDWWYFVATRNTTVQIAGLIAGLAGFVIPVFVPLGMSFSSSIRNNPRLKNAAYAIIQAGILGLAISTSYKVFTGRPGLPHGILSTDISQIFRFGILRGGAFQGWPSSHTSVAFAMSTALVMLYPENKYVRFFAIFYALVIGVGASVGFHWFSDFAAGIILGCVVGITVGKRYRERLKNLPA